jgi:hypothetical protein
MIELLGLVFGGVARLGQHWLELRDKDKERAHEAVMYDKQLALADKTFAQESALKQMDADAAQAQAEWQALMAGAQAQAAEAQAAGGWVAKLSASVRPAVTYWLMALYTAAKAATLWTALSTAEASFAVAVRAMYTEADAALLSSILSFWFLDRSLRKR